MDRTSETGTPQELATRDRAALAAARHVDPIEEPSVEWGWHQHFPRAARLAGLIVGLMTLTLLIGHQANGIEISYVIATALILVGLAIRSSLRRRKSWRP